MAGLIEKRYGRALFELALEEGELDKTAQELKIIKQVVDENPDFMAVLEHPRIVREQKIIFIKNCFEGKVSDDIVGFLITLVEANRQKEFLPMIDYFLEEVKKYQHIGKATVVSAYALSGEQKSRIQQRLIDTTEFISIDVDYKVDPEVIGGLKIRIGDRIVDNTIRTKIDTMVDNLLKG